MMNEQKVPQLRFSGFEDEWEEKEIKSFISDFTVKNDKTKKYPILTSSRQGIESQEEHFGNIQQHDTTDYNVIPNGYCTYRNRSDDYSFVFNVNKLGYTGIVSKFYPVFTFYDDNTHFITEDLNSNPKLIRDIAMSAIGTGQKVLSYNDFKELKILKPTLKEQQKIGSFLSKIDSLIQAKTQKLECLKCVKKSLLQKCFPKDGEKVPQMRFEGFSGNWEEKKLGEICDITMGQSPDGSTYSEKPSTYILVQGNADMKDGFVCPRVWTTQKTKCAYKGDLIFSVRAPVGEVGKTEFDVVIGRGVASIRGNEFIFQCLKKMNEFGYWDSISCGSTFESINSDGLRNAIVKIPSINEQQKIGQFFSKYDSVISLHQKEIDNLQTIKKSLLQKMFV